MNTIRCVDSATSAPDTTDPGYYLVTGSNFFTLHMSTSQQRLRALRRCVAKVATRAGTDPDHTDHINLVVTELIGNVVRQCGDSAPVIVRVAIAPDHTEVDVHDPLATTIPRKRRHSPDNTDHETGRGLWILDALASDWTITRTPFGKWISCRLPRGPVAEFSTS
ncbi:ATP-binding protein [Kitasatospora acidiphila]|uniref:ATP-binding protein n=1 Tax=Kitasatospora acidiphila TaxID=2567942 RepID=UPI003C714978